MSHLSFSLIIPLWNEEKNIPALITMLEDSKLPKEGMSEVVLVNNGSQDTTGALIDELSKSKTWIKPVQLKENLNYGGGVYQGMLNARNEILAYIPGDLQVSADDVKKMWLAYQDQLQHDPNQKILLKSWRTVRKDGINTQMVSAIYTFLANLILGLGIKDVNGLPKMFNRSLLAHLPDEKMRTFVFDAQILYTAKLKSWKFLEVPVTFHARRTGVSSWSQKRIQTYINSLKQIIKLRTLIYP